MSDKKIAPVQPALKVSPQAVKDPEIVVYVGPTFKGATKGTIYNHGLPPAMEEIIQKKPPFKELLVSIAELPKANQELLDQDSARNRIYRIAEDYLKKGE